MMLAMLVLLIFSTSLYIFADTMRPTLFEATRYFSNMVAGNLDARPPTDIAVRVNNTQALRIRRQQENAFAAHFFLYHASMFIWDSKPSWIKIDYTIIVETYVSLFVFYLFAARWFFLCGLVNTKKQIFREDMFY